jgi:hypothetical protein
MPKRVDPPPPNPAGPPPAPLDPAPVPRPVEPELEREQESHSKGAAFMDPAPLPVGPGTPFRALGDVPWAVWHGEHVRLGSPFTAAEQRACWEAFAGAQAIALDRGIAESTLGANMIAPNNWLGLRVPGSLAFQRFDAPAACARELVRRWTDPGYKGGVYMPRDLSLRGMLTKYAPPHENPTERLIAQAVERINRWRAEPGDTDDPPPRPAYDFSFRGWPAGFDRRILRKPPSGNGWDALGSRTEGMCATVCHITDGHDDRDAIWRLFSLGGARAYDAATDAVIDRTGKGYLLLDPWSADPMEGSGMTPWASGPANGLEGPGIPFSQKLGLNAANKFGFSTEHCNKEGQAFTDAQMDLSAKVHAVVVTRARIPWDRWPRNPNVGGLYVALKHRDFAAKACPGYVWNEDFHRAWVQAVALEAKKLQTGSGSPTPIPVPDPEPEQPVLTRFGLPLEQIAHYWGSMTRFNADGTTTPLPFNPKGVLSNLWLERFGPLGIFPEAEELRTFDAKLGPGKEMFATWEGGYVAWLPSDNAKATWRWLDRTEVPA